ncbi:hypothetical protein [Endozoicomonas sp. 2B-B]
MIRQSLFAASLSLLVSFSFISQTKALTRCFIVEFEQGAGSQKQSFSIKPARHSFPVDPTVIPETNDYAVSGLPPDEKRQRAVSYGLKMPLIESISWQLLYAYQLLAVYQLILTTRDAPPGPAPYSWLSVEAVVAVGVLLKNYWKRDSLLFNPIKQQSASMLIQKYFPFATFTAMFGSGDDLSQYPAPESSGQQASQTGIQHKGSLTSPLDSGSGDGNGGSQQHQHTWGLNCFVYPCHGVCQFRPLIEKREPVDWPLNFEEIFCPHLANGHCLGCIGRFDPENASDSRKDFFYKTVNDPSAIQLSFDSALFFDDNSEDGTTQEELILDLLSSGSANTTYPAGPLNDDVQMPGDLDIANGFEIINGSINLNDLLEENGFCLTLSHSETPQRTTESSRLDQSQPYLSRAEATPATDSRGQLICEYYTGKKICELAVLGQDGQQPCGKVFDNIMALRNHKKKDHSGEKNCDLTSLGQDGQQQPCRVVCKNAQALSYHKNKCHSGQQTCDISVVGQGGQQQPCGKVFKNIRSLADHKSKYHTGQKICERAVVGKDGQQRPCGEVCKNARAFLLHKSNYHSEQKTCVVTVVGEDGQQRPCGEVFRNLQSLSGHKSRRHSRKQNCDFVVVGQDGQQRPCGKVCKNIRALSDHKRKYHTGKKNCELAVVDQNGQQQPCETVCKNAIALLGHKKRYHSKQRVYRKRKPVDVGQGDESVSKKLK